MRIAALIAALTLSYSAWAGSTNAAYIKDLEGLLNSVESRDPSRPVLTLKLADALFNEALTLSGNSMPTDAEKHKISSDRKRSLQLYREAATGLNGLFTVPSGAAKGKIQFQMARLYSDLGDGAAAEQIFKDLSNQDSMPDVQRESLLRLAEVMENRASKADQKQAETYYKKALTLCTGQDVCSYIHYRLSWVYNRQDRFREAIAEVEQALWDSKGQVREESLRDMIGFMGGMGDDGKEALTKIEKLSAKLKRTELIGQLSDSYFAHGNRKAGVYVLDAVNRKAPAMKSYVRLMEEDYGFRDWQKFEADLDGANELRAKGDTTADVESEKIVRRLTVQLDGERISQPKAADAFKRTVMFYLTLYPNNGERTHMIDGWIAAETDDAAKIKQLQTWVDEESKYGREKEAVRLRKIRAALAQKTKNFDVVAEEMTALKSSAGSASEKRETIYQIAYAHYQNKDYVQALPKFQEIAAIPQGSYTPDKWAIQSEHLALDILAQKKDYSAVLAQARAWSHDPRYSTWLKTVKEGREDLADVKKIEESAEFEWATSLGNTPEALAIFARDCEEGRFAEKSCSNAQVLAVKLGDQKTLIEILQKLGKKDELASELEAGAEFVKAAQMLEPKLKEKTSATRDYLKVALLYELGASPVNRDRVLHLLEAKVATQKTLGEEEDLIFQTFKDADLINVSILKLPWKKENHEFLTDYLASHGKTNAAIQAELVKSCHDTGPAWEKAAVEELRRLDQKQKAMHFVGNGSKKKFEVRVAALKGLMDKGACYLQSTTPRQRAIFATLLSRSQLTLADEIKATTIPDGVDDEAKTSLLKALAEMAQPFIDKGQELDKLVTAQLEKIEDAGEREALKQKIEAKDDGLYAQAANTSPRDAVKTAAPQSSDALNAAVAELHRNPNQRASLEQLKTYYESAGQPRLAAYFQGRLLQLGSQGDQGVKQ
jgi:hypothetical protein